MRAGYRLSVDIGGTFTDATLVHEASGEIRIAKVLTTPTDPSAGFVEAVQALVESPAGYAEVAQIVHATTIATNAIIERTVARTGFVTTDGFRDILEIARQMRPSLYDPQFEKPPALVARRLCVGVGERMDARGTVLAPLDEEAVYAAANFFRKEGVAAIAICLLHSYVDSSHEERVAEILETELPGVVISASCNVAREFREYYRASTTVINASLRPLVTDYLERIERRLAGSGMSANLSVMQSNGGVIPAKAARERPVHMVESGPAAGVLAAAYLGEALGHRNVISLDMGGTTAKTCLIEDATPRITKEYEVGSTASRGFGSSRGSGYPIRTPVIDLVEIGAGGGSIAWVDAGGALRVGPRSASADPGPVCYGRGGTEPTITDANLVLGRLSASNFLGGRMELDVERAHNAIEQRCGRELGLGVIETAHGIIEIANAAMVNALRLVSVQRGYDPREFVLIAFGGAGPLHANRLATENGMRTIVIPTNPGVLSARGLLVSDLRHDYSLTQIGRLDAADGAAITAGYARLEAEAEHDLREDGVAASEAVLGRGIEMRYLGQSFELSLAAPNGAIDAPALEALGRAFHAEHELAYGFSALGEPVEIVNLRLVATGTNEKPELQRVAVEADASGALTGTRPVYFGESDGFVDCAVYDRYRLGAGAILKGPAVVEELDSTTVIHPGSFAGVDAFGNLVLESDATDA